MILVTFSDLMAIVHRRSPFSPAAPTPSSPPRSCVPAENAPGEEVFEPSSDEEAEEPRASGDAEMGHLLHIVQGDLGEELKRYSGWGTKWNLSRDLVIMSGIWGCG